MTVQQDLPTGSNEVYEFGFADIANANKVTLAANSAEAQFSGTVFHDSKGSPTLAALTVEPELDNVWNLVDTVNVGPSWELRDINGNMYSWFRPSTLTGGRLSTTATFEVPGSTGTRTAVRGNPAHLLVIPP